MINSAIHHIGLSFIDVETAEQFFDALLVEFMGLEKEEVWEAAAGWKGRGTRIYIYPRETSGDSGTMQHLAFSARSKEEVDTFIDWAKARAWQIGTPPKYYPEYGPDYYATFFPGPEGLQLEFVYLSEVE